MTTENKRWVAVAYYRTNAGMIDVEFEFEELEDLHDLIERGPDWHALDRIEIRLSKNLMPGLTIEESLTI